MKSISKELIGASATILILSILRSSDSYGYEIVQRVKEQTGGKVSWKVASVYPVLRKLENSGMIKSYWKMVEKERPRKYYTLLTDGNIQLEQNKLEWELVNGVFQNLWNPA